MPLLVLAIVFLQNDSASAHHGAHYKTLWKAYKKKDLQSAKVLFSKECWTEKKGDISGEELSKLLSRATQIDGDIAREYSSHDKSRDKCILGIQFYVDGEKEPRRYWLLSERVHDKKTGPLKFRVVTITTSNKLVASHIRRPTKYPLSFPDFPRADKEQDSGDDR